MKTKRKTAKKGNNSQHIIQLLLSYFSCVDLHHQCLTTSIPLRFVLVLRLDQLFFISPLSSRLVPSRLVLGVGLEPCGSQQPPAHCSPRSSSRTAALLASPLYMSGLDRVVQGLELADVSAAAVLELRIGGEAEGLARRSGMGFGRRCHLRVVAAAAAVGRGRRGFVEYPLG